ncbi:MAG: hypothetical protein LBR15_02880, partial [Methanobrevibacter sp.]|nr:hypothetical protein [Candidatus Methanovirga australis]
LTLNIVNKNKKLKPIHIHINFSPPITIPEVKKEKEKKSELPPLPKLPNEPLPNLPPDLELQEKILNQRIQHTMKVREALQKLKDYDISKENNIILF